MQHRIVRRRFCAAQPIGRHSKFSEAPIAYGLSRLIALTHWAWHRCVAF